MKKKMIVLLAAALMTLGASNAFAYFGNDQLIEVLFDTSQSKEVAIDLGTLSTTNGGTTYSLALGSPSLLSVTSAQAGFTLGTATQVSFYAIDETNGNGIVSHSATTAPVQLADISSTMVSAINNIGDIYTTQIATGATTAGNSFNSQMRGNGAIAFAGYIDQTVAPGSYEPKLGTAAAANLGIWSVNDITGSLGNGNGAVTLQSLANVSLNGTTEITSLSGNIQTNATPIPAAAYLLGSGLLGMFGFRRKGNKA